MKKNMMLFLSILLILTGCGDTKKDPAIDGKGEIYDAKKFISDQIKINESFASSLENAESGKEAATAMNSYSTDMMRLQEIKKRGPRSIRGLDLKYPEKAPAELRELAEQNLKAAMKAMTAYKTVLMRYRLNPDVKKAQADMNKLKEN